MANEKRVIPGLSRHGVLSAVVEVNAPGAAKTTTITTTRW